MADDLGVADFAQTTDLYPPLDPKFCDEVRAAADGGVAANCAVAVFGEFLRCFQPSGACGSTTSPNPGAGRRTCFENGAFWDYSYILGSYKATYYGAGKTCLYAYGGSGGKTDYYVPAGENPDAGYRVAATYNSSSGIITCADGTRIRTTATNTSLMGCEDIDQRMNPSCPVDTITCAP